MQSSVGMEQPIHTVHRENMECDARKFEDLAIGVARECYQSDPKLVAQLFQAPVPSFGDNSLLSIAHSTLNLRFFAEQSTQTVINALWFGRIKHTTPAYYIVASLFLPFLPNILNLEDKSKLTSHNDKYFLLYFKKPFYFYFLSAPVTKFWIDAVSYMALLFLYTFVTLGPVENGMQQSEWLLFVWFIALFCEYVRQFFIRRTKFTKPLIKTLKGILLYSLSYLTQQFCDHYLDAWNILNSITYGLYFTSVGIRLGFLPTSINDSYSHILLSLNALFMYFRVLRYYSVSPTLGPKLIMMKRMIHDMSIYCALLVVFVLAYGIASQGILRPGVGRDNSFFSNVVYRAYYHTYGELMLDDSLALSNCIGPDAWTGCDDRAAYLVPIILAFYLLFTNIMLVNLLIAMFNDTFVKVAGASLTLWNAQNFELYESFRSQSPWPAFTVLVWHLWSLIFGLYKLWSDWGSDPLSHVRHGIHEAYDSFQISHTERYLFKYGVNKNKNDSERIEKSEMMLRDLLNISKDSKEEIMIMRMHIERQDVKIRELLKANTSTRLVPTKIDFPLLDVEKFWHCYSGNKAIKRTYIDIYPSEWSTPLHDYLPMEYTDITVLALDTEAVNAVDVKEEFNKLVNGRNRISHTGIYNLDEISCRPLNPKGRSGIAGRGSLQYWGPNHYSVVILTRWKRSLHQAVFERDSKPMIECLCMFDTEKDAWILPGKNVSLTSSAAVETRIVFHDTLVRILEESGRPTGLPPLLETLKNQGLTIAEGFIHDERNTDHAWVEMTAVNFHDDDGHHGLSHLNVNTDSVRNSFNLHWITAHARTNIDTGQRFLLENVVLSRNAYW